MSETRHTHASLLRRKRRVIADLEQMIRDVQYWNRLPQAEGRELDLSPERAALEHARRSEQLWLDHRTAESAAEWNLVIAALQGPAHV